MESIEHSINSVSKKIETACGRAGRSTSEIRLIGVTKRVDVDSIKRAIMCGLRDFGENYIQEAKRKIEEMNPPGLPLLKGSKKETVHEMMTIEGLPSKGGAPSFFGEEVCWHMIGHIQTNKVKHIPNLFHYVHSVDRWEILELLDAHDKEIKVLFELNLSGEITKQGTTEDNLRRMLERVHELKNIKPVGLMTMAPFVDNPEEVRGIFSALRETLYKANSEFSLDMKELSMGMSSDFEVAIEEGATMVRIGTAIFGERS